MTTRSRPPQQKSGPSPQRQQRKRSTPQTLLASYRPDLSDVLVAAGEAPFRHAQVLEHLMRRPLRPFSEASALPAELRTSLDRCGPTVLRQVASRQASDGTVKLLLSAGDGSSVETVVMPYGSRVTACISSQVGCAVGCGFCATGAIGFRRNLVTAEIVDQLRAAATVASAAGRRVSNVVYMGMGEPLLNLGAVLESIRLLTDPSGLGLGHRALAVSTVGIPAGMLRLARSEPQVNLALSLHAADDATRALLIPSDFRHPLSDILAAAWEHFALTRRKLLVEYVLISGVNDSVDDARRLAALLRGRVVAVNLLAWNPVCPPDSRTDPRVSRQSTQTRPASRLLTVFRPPSPAAVAAFRSVLRDAHIETVVRQSKGAGIDAACGQLAGREGSYITD